MSCWTGEDNFSNSLKSYKGLGSFSFLSLLALFCEEKVGVFLIQFLPLLGLVLHGCFWKCFARRWRRERKMDLVLGPCPSTEMVPTLLPGYALGQLFWIFYVWGFISPGQYYVKLKRRVKNSEIQTRAHHKEDGLSQGWWRSILLGIFVIATREI